MREFPPVGRRPSAQAAMSTERTPCTRHGNEVRSEGGIDTPPERHLVDKLFVAFEHEQIIQGRCHVPSKRHAGHRHHEPADQDVEPTSWGCTTLLQQEVKHVVLKQEAHPEDDPADAHEARREAESAMDGKEQNDDRGVNHARHQMQFLQHVHFLLVDMSGMLTNEHNMMAQNAPSVNT